MCRERWAKKRRKRVNENSAELFDLGGWWLPIYEFRSQFHSGHTYKYITARNPIRSDFPIKRG